jgi:hypothetical protein
MLSMTERSRWSHHFFQLIGSHIPSCMGPNRKRWKLRNKAFDSRSLYYALKGANRVQFPWKEYFGAKAPQRVSFFVWTVAWGKILKCVI